MHYYIDGYNLLFGIVDHFQGSVESSRIELVNYLDEMLEKAEMQATVIFDNHSDLATAKPGAEYTPFLNIIFSPKGLCADAYLIELVQGMTHTNLVTVVTSDVSLANTIAEMGVKTNTTKDFLCKLFRRLKTRKSPTVKPANFSHFELERWQKIFEERIQEYED